MWASVHSDAGSRKLLLLVLFITLAGRLITVKMVPMSTLSYSESGVIAQEMYHGNGYSFNFFEHRNDNPLQSFIPPLYTGVVWTCLILFENAQLALGFTHALLSTATVLLIFIVARELTKNRMLALLTALGVGLYPAFILSISRAHSLILNTFLLSLFLTCCLYVQQSDKKIWVHLLGLVFGLTLYARSMLILFLPLYLVWLWFNLQENRKRIFTTAAIVAAWSFVLLMPWWVRNYSIHGQFVFMTTNRGFAFWNGNNPFTTGSGLEVFTDQAYAYLGQPRPDGLSEITNMTDGYPLPADVLARIDTISEVEMDDRLWEASWQFIFDNPDQWWQGFLIKARSFLWFRPNLGLVYEASWTYYYKIMYGALSILLVAGIYLSRHQWRRYSLLYMLFGYYFLFYSMFHVQTRYRWEIEPFYLLFAALTIMRLAEAIISAYTKRSASPTRDPASDAASVSHIEGS